MKIPQLIVLIGILLGSLYSRAQDPLFSQFYATPLQISPAFVGSSHAPRAGIAYRNQWTGFNNAYRTYSVFYEQSLERLNSGVGFNVEGDDAGDGILRTLRASALFSYRLQMAEKWSVRIGSEIGLHQTTLAWEKLVFPDQIDPLQGPVITTSEVRPERLNTALLDLSAGFLLIGPHFWFSLGLKHLNTPDQGLFFINDNLSGGLPLRYTLNAGMELPLSKSNKAGLSSFISPNVLFASQGPYRQVNAGAYVATGPIFGGAWFRHTLSNADAVIMLIGFRQELFKIGLSYDITVSELAGRAGGTYEVTFGLFFDRGRRRPIDWNDCGRMFR